MDRRSFGKMAMLGFGAGMLSCTSGSRTTEGRAFEKITKIKPEFLKVGDIIGLIAPASPISDTHLKRSVAQLEELGFDVKLGKNIKNDYGYLAGKDEERLEDLHAMFADEEVKAIWCIRGGYGTSRLLPSINYELIAANPKIIMGYSDITALLQAIYLKTGLVGFHGPVAATELTDYNLLNIQNLVLFPNKKAVIDQFKAVENPFKTEIIHPGRMSGELAGGNLSLLAALSGTEYALDATGKLVFIEDIGEKPYRIDRMLTQLIQSANLHKAGGILLGQFNDCDPEEDDRSLSLIQTLKDRLEKLGVPVFYGFSFGHVSNLCTLPIGIEAEFDMDKEQLTLLESTVIS